MRWWNSRKAQGGSAGRCLSHAIQTTNAMTTAATAAAILMRTIRARYPSAQDRAQGPTGVPAYNGTRTNAEAILGGHGHS